MTQTLSMTDFSKPIYLQYLNEKFWELKLDFNTYQTTIRQGKLMSNGKENILSIQFQEHPHTSLRDACQFAEMQVNFLVSNGYTKVEKGLSQSMTASIPLVYSQDTYTPIMRESQNRSTIEKSRSNFARPKRRAQESLPRNDSKQAKRSYSGSEVDVDCEDSVSNYTGTEVGNNTGFWGFFKNLFTKKKDEIRKTIVVSEQVLKNIVAVEQKCDDLGLTLKVDRNTLHVIGEPEKVTVLENYIIENEEDMGRSGYPQADEANLVRKEIILSDYLLGMSGQIAMKASQLNIHSNIEGNKLVLYGPDKAIVELFGHLMDLQASPVKNSPYREMTQAMQDNLFDIKKKMEDLEIRRGNETRGFYQEDNRRTDSVNSYLTEIRGKMEALETRMANFGGVGQNEAAIIQVLNENLFDLKNKVGGLEMKMEVDADGLLQEEMKFQKQMYDSIGAINRKIEAVDHKVKNSTGDSMQKDMRMKGIQDNIDTIAKKLLSLEQKLENTKSFGVDVDQIMGKVKNFVHDGLTKVGVQKEEDVTQKQISISAFHRSSRREIERKAAELKLITDFGYDVILATGTPKNIESFIVYLQECEMNVKKSLYPKHWDLFEQRKFSLVNVPHRSAEFNEVSTLFNNTHLQYRPIVKVERIQNKYLMDTFITHVQKRKELRNDNNLQRRQLFFGGVNPEVICKSDVGFDIQYAENKGCGKGLYFYDTPPGNMNYQNAFRTPQGTYKVLIADVLVGRSQNVYKGDPSISKAPEGFDSVNTNNAMGNGKTYAIFNNFHSYPLYVVEYQ